MTDDAQNTHDRDEMPSREELQEPSVETDPGQEPQGGDEQPEPSHEAVGIGVVGRPQVDPETVTPEEGSE